MSLKTAIKLAESQANLARLLDVSQQAICNWKRRGVPPEQCLQIEIALRGAVTRADLRPDLFGAAKWPKKAVTPARARKAA
jgi:DNA-binding transcriptional regulator YdaS (Cro superfamily)